MNSTEAVSTSPSNAFSTGWLTTSASQIFLMQLGFACFEVGFVEINWSKSIIIKNLEATIIGILTYICFGYTLSSSDTPLFNMGITGNFKHIFLADVEPTDYELIFISTTYATTAGTIISGAVLERMKNYTYCIWCFLTLFVTYSIISYWVWNSNGWLYKLGFIDCAGSVVIHGTGGVASIIAMYALGPRMHSIKYLRKNRKPKLKEIPSADRPILILIGSLLLWFGWYAFNVTSPFLSNVQIGHYLGIAGLNTLIAPSTAAVSGILYMNYIQSIKYEDLIGCVLSGAVAATAGCYTVSWFAAAITGFVSSFLYFASIWFVRKKLVIDDPLCVTSVHLFCGYLGCFAEGLFANGTVSNAGLFYGGIGHFGVQCLGIIAIFLFEMVVSIFLWYIILDKLIVNKCKKTDLNMIRVQTLDTYLGIPIWEIDINKAFMDILKCQSDIAKTMLLEFHCECLKKKEDEENEDEKVDEVLVNNNNFNNKTSNYYSNALDFLLIVMNNEYDGIQQKMDIFNMYIAKNSKYWVKLFDESMIDSAEKLCKIDDNNCFKDIFDLIYDELKSFTQEFLKNINIKRQNQIHIMPYSINKSNWEIRWISNVSEYDRMHVLSLSNDGGVYHLLQNDNDIHDKQEGIELHQYDRDRQHTLHI